MADGTCTSWFDGNWVDCCCQHDVDCESVWPIPCLPQDNYYLMNCVIASSYSLKVKHPCLVRANAILMFVGVGILNPIITTLRKSDEYGGELEEML